MQLHDFLSLLAAEAKAWTDARRGTFRISGNPQDPFLILGGGQHTGFVVILDFAGDRPAEADVLQDMTEISVDFYVGHAQDLRNDPGAWLFKATPAGVKPLLQQVDELRARMLTCVFYLAEQDDPSYAVYQGAQPVVLPNLDIPLPAYKFTLSWNNRVSNDDDYRFLNAPASAKDATPGAQGVTP